MRLRRASDILCTRCGGATAAPTGTLRGRHRLTGKGVEVGDEAAAELLDLGEGVDLAALVDGEQLLADPDVEGRRGTQAIVAADSGGTYRTSFQEPDFPSVPSWADEGAIS
jgi:hypothetical protein